jgi:phosphoglycerol transferase MdoB-like AlkP superfamily enzyme
MKSLFQKNTILNLLAKLGIVLFFLEFYRILLLLTNSRSFPNFGIFEHVVGIWFDIITVALYYLPFIALTLLPLPRMVEKIRSIVLIIVFSLTSFLVYVFNAMDVAYFSYVNKRTSFDYLVYMLSNDETSNLAGDFILEFWWLLSFFFISFFGTIYLYRKLKTIEIDFRSKTSYFTLITALLLTVLVGRGGFQLKPIGILESTNYCSLQNSPAVLNSAFTIIKTFDYEGVEKKEYFTESKLNSYFNPIQLTSPQNILNDSTNVVFVLFESFGSMYVGPNNPESYSPYLDSILAQSMYFDEAIANCRTSMDAIPTVVSSIPTWMNESFILSSYSSNQFQSIPSILKEKGYSSAFYHGCTNGSMRFDAFAAAAGFDNYFGRTEYNNEKHFDGNWGIWDHHFMPWTLDKMDEAKKPFFSLIFTLSSHHPYTIPKEFSDKVKRNPKDPICGTISYVDIVFQSFWEKAQTKKWFKNTIFIFCADHVGPTKRNDRVSLNHSYRIPIAFYHPSGKLPQIPENTGFQQIDILPTLLDLLNIKTKYYAFGTSYFNPRKQPKIVYSQENLICFRPGKEPITWNDRIQKKWSKEDQLVIRQMKAIYQHYTNDLIENRLVP